MPDKVYALSLLVSSLLNKVIAFEERNPNFVLVSLCLACMVNELN